MISILLDVVGGAFLLLGLTLVTISLFGVLRLPDAYSQLHALGLATGPGVIAVLASSVATEEPRTITFAALAIAFVALTSPVSGHTIARAAHRRNRRIVGGTDNEPDEEGEP